MNMNKYDLLKATIEGQETERVPCSVWMHFSQYDQDPRSLAEHQVEFCKKYDYDFIKLMPFGAYSTQDWGSKIEIYCDPYKEPVIVKPGIECIDDYYKIKPLKGLHGTHGQVVQLAAHVQRLTDEQIPYLQTIFSPGTTLKKLSHKGLLDDMREHPEAVHTALRAITETTIDFINENLKYGVSGFFFANQFASYDTIDDDLFKEFIEPYDMVVMDAYKDKTWFNVAHIHGSNIMFDKVKNYPCNVLSWHDRDTYPSIKEAAELTDKCFLGGIHEVPTIIDGKLSYASVLASKSKDEIIEHVHQAIDMAGAKNLIVGPGCVCDPRTSEANLHAVREAVGNYKY